MVASAVNTPISRMNFQSTHDHALEKTMIGEEAPPVFPPDLEVGLLQKA